MTTYLVGLDGSEHARDALAWALAVARRDDSIVALHAWEQPAVTGYDGTVVVDPAETEAASARFMEAVLAEIDDDRVDGQIVEGSPGRSLVRAATTLGPDVAVIVGHGGSGKMSLLLGSTAHHVVHHTDRPVVVARGDLRLPVRHVVVGVDGFEHGHDPDEHSMAALRWALQVPGVATVEVCHADFVPGVAAGPVREPGVESDAEAAADDARLRRAIELGTGGTGSAPSGADVVPVVAAGTGAFALIEASREVDLVVVGSRGRAGLVELVVGSTTLEVLAHAHCPVAVVR